MCGIAAILAPPDSTIPDGAIERMTLALAHRGPDGSGCLRTSGCQLGHTRLSVIDPAGGQQPMSDPTGRYHIVFNGEIFNYRELRRDLKKRGTTFRTNSDTEVLLLAYREFGANVVDHLNGQFAFGIWDAQARRFFAARDRLGEKPLYWGHSPRGHLVVASEIRGLLAANLIQSEIDLESVDAYLTLIYVPPDRSIYQNVRPLLPGHVLEWENGKQRTWEYWKPQLSTVAIDAVEAARHTRRLIERAVERQMVADVPVGAFLSGGLDSSTIVALASRHTAHPIQTFAAGFGELIDELPFARCVATAYGTRHAEMQMDIPVAECLERMADVYDEPFGDSSNIPTFLLSEFARRKVKVVLSGDGGDELFGGYSWYETLLDHDETPSGAASLWQARLRAKLTRTVARFKPAWSVRGAQAVREYKGIRAKRAYPDLWRRHLAAVSSATASLRRQLWRHPSRADCELSLAERFAPAVSLTGVDRAVDFDLRCYLAGDIFAKVDRAAMAHGLETRSPFMDRELVEFVLSLPASVRFEGPQLKTLLRRSCSDLWPESIRGRSKQGFGAPLSAWLQRPDVRSVVDRVFRPGAPLVELLPGARVASVRSRCGPQAVWNLICLGLWLEKRPACLNRLSSVA